MAATAKEEEEIYGAKTFYRELGYFITYKEQYERALKAFDVAYDKTPDDKRTLLGRSIGRCKAVQYPGALADINHALENEPEDLRLLAQKALCTYLSCDFEQALIQNYSGFKKRKKPDDFQMGIMNASEAIENCIGARAGRPLRDHYKIIRRLAWRKAREALKPVVYKPQRKRKRKKRLSGRNEDNLIKIVEPLVRCKSIKAHKSSMFVSSNMSTLSAQHGGIRDSLTSIKSVEAPIPKGPPYPYKPVQDCTSNIDNLLAEKYLERLCLDKLFLKQLVENPGVSCANKAGSKKILKLARDGYKNVAYRQEVLRIRRPFYFVKYQEIILCGGNRVKEKLHKDIVKIQEITTRQAEILMGQIKTHRDKKNVKASLEACAKMKHFLDEKSKKLLPTKKQMYIELYDLVPKIILDMKRINHDQLVFNKHKRVLVALGVPVEREPSTDSVIQYLKPQIVDYKKLVKNTEQEVLTAKCSEELCWLYYNLAAYNCELKRNELSKVYARKCLTEAKRVDSPDWTVNATMIMVRLNIQQMNRVEAKNELNDVLKIARHHMDNRKLEDYLEMCLYVVDNVDLSDTLGPKLLEEREQQLIEIMGKAGIKDDAAHLFRKMSVMPGNRRMSVMPGVRFSEASAGAPTRTAARKMSIMPKAADDDEPPPWLAKKKKKKKVGAVRISSTDSASPAPSRTASDAR